MNLDGRTNPHAEDSHYRHRAASASHTVEIGGLLKGSGDVCWAAEMRKNCVHVTEVSVGDERRLDL